LKTLLVLRHAKSSWKDTSLVDHDRPLNKRGRRDAPRMGRLIQSAGIVPDLLISSTAKRARKTAQAVAEACGYSAEIARERRFYETGPQTVLQEVAKVSDEHDTVMIVGHNPTWEGVVSELTGQYEIMPTAALARIELDIEHWSDLREGSGRLVSLWRPRELPDLD